MWGQHDGRERADDVVEQRRGEGAGAARGVRAVQDEVAEALEGRPGDARKGGVWGGRRRGRQAQREGEGGGEGLLVVLGQVGAVALAEA